MANNNENKKDGGFNFPPVGGGKVIKTPKFNGYWVYIILAVVIIGFQFINHPDIFQHRPLFPAFYFQYVHRLLH